MSLLSILGILLLMIGLRLVFLLAHWRDPGALWSDYERSGLKYKFAWLIDSITLGFFIGVAVFGLSRISQNNHQLWTTFTVFFGMSLLSRLLIHKFPRTNLPGAWNEAKIDLAVHLLMSCVVGGVFAGLSAIYFWWSQ